MQALKKFNSGEADQGSGKSEGKFLALAMAEASKVSAFSFIPLPPPFSNPVYPPTHPHQTKKKREARFGGWTWDLPKDMAADLRP